MTLFQSFILGAVQGLTEFLPISSSAHLVFVQHVFGFTEPLLFYDVMVHLGTLVSLVIYFAGDLAHIVRDSIYGVSYLLHRKPMKEIAEIAPHSRWALGILAASVPTGLMGIFFKDGFEQMFGSLRNVGFELLATTVILWLTAYFHREERGLDQARYRDFILIGIAQGISIVPGVSRSAITIAAALFLGLKREDAFRFSFLIAIPAILGAGLVELKEGITGWAWGWPVLAVGFLASAVLGYLSLFFLARITQKGKIHFFAFYTFLFAVLIFFTASRLE